MNLFRRLSCVRPPALGIALLAGAAVLAVPHLLPAASTGDSESGQSLYMPQGSSADSANGDFVSATVPLGGINGQYHYFIEVPPGQTQLVVEIYDADVGLGGSGEDTEGRDRSRSGDGFNTSVTYSLFNPSATPQARNTTFTTGDVDEPALSDEEWLTFYDSTGDNVRDNFGTIAYSNNNGTVNWNGNWTETNDDNNANAGQILITGGELRIGDNGGTASTIHREANLTAAGFTTATFSFNFRTTGVDAGDDMLVQVSANGGGAWTTLETFTGPFAASSRSYNITSSINTNTRIRFIEDDGYGNNDFFFVDNLQIQETGIDPGHWELRVDMNAGDDINAIGIRANDSTEGAGGTELNVYYDSMNQLGANPPNSGTNTENYDLFPYITSGCSAHTNDFDYDRNRGNTGSMTFTRPSGITPQTVPSTSLSVDDVWARTVINKWTSDSIVADYGIWSQDATISSYTVGGTPNGNYTTTYMSNSAATDPAVTAPTANPTTNAFRVYLPTDAGVAPLKPYIEQQVTHDSGPNPPDNGQSSDVTVTVRVVNPTSEDITFSNTNVVRATVPGSGAVYAGAFQASQGLLVSQPTMLTAGDVVWNPQIVLAGQTEIMAYEVRVTPTMNGQRIEVTGAPDLANGTTATFVDETGNTTQTRATYAFGQLCELAVTENLATHATISSFQAFADESGGVRVEWTTASEAGTAGFRLMRWDAASNKYQPVHEGLLPGLLRSPQGGGYRFLDETAAPNQAQRYLLEEVEVNGKRRSYGPYSVTPDWKRQDDGPRLALANERGFEREEHPVVGRARAEEDPNDAGSQGDLRSARAFASAGSAGAHISIRETGLYYITREQVATWLGLSVDKAEKAIAKGNLSLTRAGLPVAWFPDGLSSGVGKKEDKPKNALGFYFYGETVDSLYSLDTVYRLREGSGPVMQTGTVTPSAATAAEISFPDTKPFESDAFPATAINPDPESDYWFWNFIISGDPDLGKQTFAFDAPALATGAGTLTLDLHGATDNSTPGEHQATVVLNGTTLGDTEWQGIAAHSATFPVPDGLLLATGNQLEITGTVGGGAPFSFYFIDGFKVGYPRRFTSAGDGLTFQAGGNPQVTVTGFSDSAVRLLDVSIPSQPRWLTGATVEADPGAPGTFRSSFVPVPAARYLAAGPNAVKTPFAVRPWSATDPRVAFQGTDVLIVVPPGMKSEAERLADLRRGQGLESLVVDLNEVADAFGNGIPTPHALRNFLSNAWSSWSAAPRYVVLVGEGTLDYRNLLGFGDSVMPPLMIQAEGGLFPSDNRLVDATGDGKPEMAVGRIPVVSAAELGAYIDKIIAYESAGDPAWAANAIMLADSVDGGASFSADSDGIAARLPSDFAVDRIYLDTEPLAQARDHLLQAIDGGASLINFVGHGGLDRLSGAGLLTSEDVASLNNGERLPVLTAMTCTVNRFAVPGVPSLGELLVKSGTGGAAAVWGPSGLSFHGEARQLAEVFYRLTSEPDSGRLGDRVLRSMEEFGALGGDKSMLDIYNLLGDPALLVRRGPAPPSSGGSTDE